MKNFLIVMKKLELKKIKELIKKIKKLIDINKKYKN